MINENTTMQEVFDMVVEHLAKQKVPSYHEGTCFYRIGGHKVLKCAVGCLISGEEYLKEMEDISVDKLVYTFQDIGVSKFARYTDNHLLLEDLQLAHDDSCNLTKLKSTLYNITTIYGLDDSKIPSIKEWEVNP